MRNPNCVYTFGIDPQWKEASNVLAYMNSFKMKMAVILGVGQMLFGILLKASNARFFKKNLDFWFEFVPQLVFMSSIFG